MNNISQRSNRLDRTKEIRRLHNHRANIILQHRLQNVLIERAIRTIRNLFHLQTGILRVSLQHFAIFRVQSRATSTRVRPVIRSAINTASVVAVEPSHIEAFATCCPVNWHISV